MQKLGFVSQLLQISGTGKKRKMFHDFRSIKYHWFSVRMGSHVKVSYSIPYEEIQSKTLKINLTNSCCLQHHLRPKLENWEELQE